MENKLDRTSVLFFLPPRIVKINFELVHKMVYFIMNDNFLCVCHCTWLIFIHHYPLLSLPTHGHFYSMEQSHVCFDITYYL